jgi:hypothetical protein
MGVDSEGQTGTLSLGDNSEYVGCGTVHLSGGAATNMVRCSNNVMNRCTLVECLQSK